VAVEHDGAHPRKPAGRHRRSASLSVVGQVRGLATVRQPVPARHRAAGRRIVPKAGGPLAMALDTLAEIEPLTWQPVRLGSADAVLPDTLPDVQFDIVPYVPPAQTIDGLQVQFHPVHTVFLTAKLLRRPGPEDQRALAAALAAVESRYPFRPEGLFTTVAYGVPYFERLPGGMTGPLVFRHMPRLRGDANRFVLEEAEPGGAARIDADDLLITLRSDNPGNIRDVIDWLRGSNVLAGRGVPSPRLAPLLAFTSSRAMFTQVGLPRKIANARELPYAQMLDFRSPDWIDGPAAAGGWGDGSAASAQSVTFAGADLRPSTADPGDYFDGGAIQQLDHRLLDLDAYCDQRKRPAIEAGGEAALPAAPSRLRHASAESAEAAGAAGVQAARVPVEGPGFDAFDSPDGAKVAKVHAGSFFPTAEAAGGVRAERFATLTRRQNFLVPPRRHRSFPLAELA
jgi:hypothetical protein